MASLAFCSSLSSTQRFPSFRSSSSSSSSRCSSNPSSAVCFSVPLGRRKTRGVSLVTRAGPSTNTYLFAFFLPFSLLALTVITSINIDMKLDRLYMEDMAISEAMADVDAAADDDDEDDGNVEEEEDGDFVETSSSSPRETPVRTRNRPKKEVET